MPFGKHKGTPVSLIPLDYLDWLYANVQLRPRLKKAVEARLGIEPEPVRPTSQSAPPDRLERVLGRWHRESCLRWHPDRAGGDPAVMKALNDAMDRLRAALKREGAM